MNGSVVAICICPTAGGPMQHVMEVEVIFGRGLVGDRYADSKGSFNKKRKWWQKIPFVGQFFKTRRQVTLMNLEFFRGSGFDFDESRRNILTKDVELMWLIGREFQIGAARFRGVKYCDPCNKPSKLSGKSQSFKQTFQDRGGLIAEVIRSGVIRVGDLIIPPPKGY